MGFISREKTCKEGFALNPKKERNFENINI